MRVVINACFGGYSLSEGALVRLKELGCPKALAAKSTYSAGNTIPRNDTHLLRVVEEMGDDAGGRFSRLRVVDVPDDADWEIAEYDGFEHVAEKHRIWHFE